MRTLLRGVAIVVTAAARVFIVVSGVACVSLLIVLVRGELTSAVVSVSVLLLVVFSGILWCANRIALTPVTTVSPGSPLVRNALRLLAVVQTGLGLILVVVTGLTAFPYIRIGARHQTDHALLSLALLPGAVGLACVGGVLWCVTQVAYPPETTSTPIHTSSPPAGMSGVETRSTL
ncbi:hypothetical protein J0H58_07620 [bacterium]|nr:hypothetical protein [bacterium]